jgi:hypothetical protein
MSVRTYLNEIDFLISHLIREFPEAVSEEQLERSYTKYMFRGLLPYHQEAYASTWEGFTRSEFKKKLISHEMIGIRHGTVTVEDYQYPDSNTVTYAAGKGAKASAIGTSIDLPKPAADPPAAIKTSRFPFRKLKGNAVTGASAARPATAQAGGGDEAEETTALENLQCTLSDMGHQDLEDIAVMAASFQQRSGLYDPKDRPKRKCFGCDSDKHLWAECPRNPINIKKASGNDQGGTDSPAASAPPITKIAKAAK